MKSSDGEKVFYGAHDKVTATGAVELWLQAVEESMRSILKKELQKCLNQTQNKRNLDHRVSLVKQFPGQLVITASQLEWTRATEAALKSVQIQQQPKALKNAKAKQHALIKKYVENVVDPQLENINRLKIVALITIEQHAREVMEKMLNKKCESITSFEWI